MNSRPSAVVPMLLQREVAQARDVNALSQVNAQQFVTVEDFARIARVSRRTIDRYRQARPVGFPKEYDIGRGRIPRPRFKLQDVLIWMESRALW